MHSYGEIVIETGVGRVKGEGREEEHKGENMGRYS